MTRLVLLLNLRRQRCSVICLMILVLIASMVLLSRIMVITVRPSCLGVQTSEDVFQFQLSEYEERLKRIERVCKRFHLDMAPSAVPRCSNFERKMGCKRLWPMIVDEKSRLISCLVPKVATTTINGYFLRLLNNEKLLKKAPNPEEFEAFHVFVRKVLRRVTVSYYNRQELDQFYKFMIVRHPFERLVSAFVDKALKSRDKGFYNSYWIPMMRVSGRKVITNTSQPTFREFVHHLLSTPMEVHNEHWTPFWSRCEPCRVKYDFVGKLENADLDIPYALSKYPIKDELLVYNSGSNTSAKAKEFFSELTADEVFGLYTKFYLDFELFGYTIDEYIEGKDVRDMDTWKV